MTRAEGLKRRAARSIDVAAAMLTDLSHRISDNPEIGLQEVRAAQWLADVAASVPGTRLQTGVGGMPTAFVAECGEGDFVITLCAEYDALPELGHGCGHNIIAAAAIGAYCALGPLAGELAATVRLVGTPAEENEGGKVRLLEAGVFDGTHLAAMVHPAPIDEVSMNPYASATISAVYHGKQAHASMAPHEGVNALDALTVALTAIGLARQQLEPGQQVHGTVTSGGGAPNVIPAATSGVWMVRAKDLASLQRVRDRIEACLRAGALATGCRVDIDRDDLPYANMRIDGPLTELYRRNIEDLGREPAGVPPLGGSTDMGNVSQAFPSIHPMIGLGDPALVLHTAEFAAAARGPEGDNALLDGARALAYVAIDACTQARHRTRLMGPDRLAAHDAIEGAV